MPRQLIDLYLVDLSENKAVYIGKTEFILSDAWSEEVGEIELWAMSVPHRAVNPDAKEARAKIIVTLNDGSTEKFQGYFSRGGFRRYLGI